MKLETTNKIRLGLLFSLFIVVAAIWSIIESEIQLKENKEYIINTYEKLIQLEEITTLMTDAQRGVRGYQISKDETFLEPYFGTREKVDNLYNQLDENIDKDLLDEFDSLGKLIVQNFKVLDTMVIYQQSGSVNAKVDINRLKLGKKYMDNTRYLISQLKKNESDKLDAFLAASNDYSLTNNYLIGFIFIVALCIILASYYYVQYDIKMKFLRERELIHAKKTAENANNFKSRFLANMSHEIRTPINAILGFTDVLIHQEVNKTQRDEYLEYIRSSGNLLLNLIGNILDLSKIEEGKFEINKESFCFQQVISSSISPYQYRAREKGLEFEILFDNKIPEYIISDPHLIKQIMVNLISNAIKFTKKGKIIVDFKVIDIKNSEVKLNLSVSDSGIGIPQEKYKAIFEKFTQADNSIQREFGGSGLGLTIVKQLVKLFGGELTVESPSKIHSVDSPGTTISIVLDVQADFNRVTVVKCDSLAPSENYISEEIRVLVVEDNLMNQRLAKIILKKMGCNFEFASNGKIATELLQASKFDIILMDVQMPVMDGYEATRYIRKVLNLSTPIIGLTANVFKEDIRNCIDEGMNDFLGKPYTEKQLYGKLVLWHKTAAQNLM